MIVHECTVPPQGSQTLAIAWPMAHYRVRVHPTTAVNSSASYDGGVVGDSHGFVGLVRNDNLSDRRTGWEEKPILSTAIKVTIFYKNAGRRVPSCHWTEFDVDQRHRTHKTPRQ